MNKASLFKIILATVGGALAKMLGGWDTVATVLVGFIVADFVSGILAGGICGQLSSAVCFKGILKKVLMLVVVAAAVLVDRLLGDGSTVRTTVCIFYIAQELLSILENVGRAGLPYPAQLKNIIAILNNKVAETESTAPVDEAAKEE